MGFIKRSSHLTGIEARITENGIIYLACKLLMTGGSVTVKNFEKFTDIQSLQKWLGNSLFTITLTGKGIILKSCPEKNEEESLKAILPGVNLDDFVFQIIQIKTSKIFAISRKDLVQELLESTLNSISSRIIGFHLGPSAISLTPQIDDSIESIYSTLYSLHFNESGGIETHTTESNYPQAVEISNESITPEFIISFFTAISSVLSISEPKGYSEFISKNRSSAQYETHFKKSLLVASILTLLLVGGNYIWKTNLMKQKEILETELSFYSNKKLKIDSLKLINELSERILTHSGLHKLSKSSFYADAVAVTIPQEISITEISIFPVTGSKKNLKEFNNKLIKVEGLTPNSEEFNKWIRAARNLFWVNDIVVDEYSYNSQKKKGEFIISIIIR